MELSKNIDSNPRIPKHLDITIKTAMDESFKVYEEHSVEFKGEAMYKLYRASLKVGTSSCYS